jgi:hypothetical protein
MRIALLAVVLFACDAGSRPEKPVPRPPTPGPAPVPSLVIDANLAEAATPRVIEWSVGGLGTWKDKLVTGIMWHVEIDLSGGAIKITDPGEVTKRHALTPDRVRDYTRLATAVRGEPVPAPSHSCTDRTETLRIDNLRLEDSCPIAQPAAHALIDVIQRELE